MVIKQISFITENLFEVICDIQSIKQIKVNNGIDFLIDKNKARFSKSYMANNSTIEYVLRNNEITHIKYYLENGAIMIKEIKEYKGQALYSNYNLLLHIYCNSDNLLKL